MRVRSRGRDAAFPSVPITNPIPIKKSRVFGRAVVLRASDCKILVRGVNRAVIELRDIKVGIAIDPTRDLVIGVPYSAVVSDDEARSATRLRPRHGMLIRMHRTKTLQRIHRNRPRRVCPRPAVILPKIHLAEIQDSRVIGIDAQLVRIP